MTSDSQTYICLCLNLFQLSDLSLYFYLGWPIPTGTWSHGVTDQIKVCISLKEQMLTDIFFRVALLLSKLYSLKYFIQLLVFPVHLMLDNFFSLNFQQNWSLRSSITCSITSSHFTKFFGTVFFYTVYFMCSMLIKYYGCYNVTFSDICIGEAGQDCWHVLGRNL